MQSKRFDLVKLLQRYSIEIPMLQRDYAQGRASQDEVARKFLNAIFQSLDRGDGLHLDFIYGYIENSKLILIDGQQRLTTLWLLYRYLYGKTDRLDEMVDKEGAQQITYRKLLEKFSYSVRKNSKEFCRAIVKKDFDTDKKPSQEIFNRSDFGGHEVLKDDPTVKAMIHMLDLLFEHVKDRDAVKLVEWLNNITFDFFDMGRFELGEELYIKMNARGKQLSDYENLKAAIEERLKQEGGVDGRLDGLMLHIDTLWSDYFANFKSAKNIDEEINGFDERGRNFLHYGAVYFYCKDKPETQEVARRLGKQSIDEIVEQLSSLEKMESLDRTIGVLSSLEGFVSGENLDIKGFEDLKSARFFDGKNDESDEIGRIKVCYFFLILGYMEHRTLGEVESEVGRQQFYDYLCVGRHLIENHSLNEARDVLSFVRLFGFLASVKKNQDFYEYLRDTPRAADNFHREIYALEVRKAGLIVQSRQGGRPWEGVLSKTSKNPFLIGWVDFLLDFSDPDFEVCRDGWHECNNPSFEKFEEYAALTMEILQEDFLKNNLALFQRAWLSVGDYSFHETNWFYGNRQKGIFRNREAWNRLLGAKKTFKIQHFYYKALLDKLSSKRIEESDKKLTVCMQEIVDAVDGKTKLWWEQLLIKQEGHFDFVNEKSESFQKSCRIRFFNRQKVVINESIEKRDIVKVELLQKIRNTQEARDLFDYGFYLYCKSNCGVSEYQSLEDQYCDGYEIASHFKLEGYAVICNSLENRKGVEHHQGPSIIIGDRNYPINLDEGCDVFAEFDRVLEEARNDGVLSLAKGEG